MMMAIEIFGHTHFPATDNAKSQMKQLKSLSLFKEQGDIWRLGAALGISQGQWKETGKKGTFQTIESLDPEGIFSAIMIALYPDASPEERYQKIIGHAEWGVNEIYQQNKIGTFNFIDIIQE